MFTGGFNDLACNLLMDSEQGGGGGQLGLWDPLSADCLQCRKKDGLFPALLPDALNTESISLLLLLATVSRKCLPSSRHCSVFLFCVNSLFYSLSGLGEGRRRWGGAVGTWGERWSQYSGMCLGKPRVDRARMTGRESLAEGSRGTPFNTSISFPRCIPHPRVCLVLSVSPSLSHAVGSQPACLP